MWLLLSTLLNAANFHFYSSIPHVLNVLVLSFIASPQQDMCSTRAVLRMLLRVTNTGLWNPSLTVLRSVLLFPLQTRPRARVLEPWIILSPQPWHPSPKATGEFTSFGMTSVLPLSCEGGEKHADMQRAGSLGDWQKKLCTCGFHNEIHSLHPKPKVLLVLNPPKAKQQFPRQPGGNACEGQARTVGNYALDLQSRLLSCDLCSCPFSHRSMCPPGFRTLMFTAGPRIRKTSCWGCSERRSMWLLPSVLCLPFRWYPCDTNHLQLSAVLSQHFSSWG